MNPDKPRCMHGNKPWECEEACAACDHECALHVDGGCVLVWCECSRLEVEEEADEVEEEADE